MDAKISNFDEMKNVLQIKHIPNWNHTFNSIKLSLLYLQNRISIPYIWN